MIKSNINKGLTVFSLAMLITGAIDSIRNLPTTALFGSTLIFFFIFSSLVFLIPLALVSAELSATWTKEGGVYFWVKKAFGSKVGFLAIWLQWINTMVWYPTILSFIAATLAYLINPALANDKGYLVAVILSIFWAQTFLNLRGIQTSARFASFCAVVGMIIPMVLIILFAITWLLLGKPIYVHFTASNMLPSFHHSTSFISLTAIMTAFLGIELATVHVNNVDNPKKNFPKALLYSVIIILFTMIFGSLAIAFVLPKNQISLVGGVMQAFSNFLDAYHAKWMIPILTTMILIGSLGGMINWIISPAKGLLQAAENDYLPKIFTKVNQHGVAQNLLITQAILVSFMCLAFLLMPSVNGSYWLLTDLSTQLYMFMYVILFAAAIFIGYQSNQVKNIIIPFGKRGLWAVSLLGFIGCFITILVGFIPPSNIDIGSKTHYELIFSLGLTLMILPVFAFILYRKIKGKNHEDFHPQSS